MENLETLLKHFSLFKRYLWKPLTQVMACYNMLQVSIHTYIFFHLTLKCVSPCACTSPCSTSQWIFLVLFLPGSQHNCAAIWADHKCGCADLQYSIICQDGDVCKPRRNCGMRDESCKLLLGFGGHLRKYLFIY